MYDRLIADEMPIAGEQNIILDLRFLFKTADN